MKKYVKPMIVFESFTLSTNIAGDCGTTTGVVPLQDETGCGYKDPADRFGYVIFTTEMACNTKEDDGEYNGICYHVPIENDKLFNS